MCCTQTSPSFPEAVLTSTLDDLLGDDQNEGALLLLEKHPVLLGHLRFNISLSSSLLDMFEFRLRYPRISGSLLLRRERARALGMLEMGNSAPTDTLEERGARLVEERLRQIRAEVASRAIGAPFR